MTDAFVTWDERQGRLDRPISLGRMQVGVADAGGGDLHQDLAGAGHRHLDFLEAQRLAEGVYHCGFHGLGHRLAP